MTVYTIETRKMVMASDLAKILCIIGQHITAILPRHVRNKRDVRYFVVLVHCTMDARYRVHARHMVNADTHRPVLFFTMILLCHVTVWANIECKLHGKFVLRRRRKDHRNFFGPIPKMCSLILLTQLYVHNKKVFILPLHYILLGLHRETARE